MSFLGGLGKIAGGVGGFLLGGPAGAAAGYGLASAFDGGGGSGGGGGGGDLGTAAGQYGGYATQDRNRFLQALNGGQEAFNTSARAAVSNAMPQFNQQLQGIRESAIRRGVSNGDLGTSYEGDLASATSRNLDNAIAGQASNLYGQQLQGYGSLAGASGNTYLDLLSGNADRAQAGSNNRWNFGAGLVGAAGQALGGYLGRRG